jgi:aminomethyltransferase
MEEASQHFLLSFRQHEAFEDKFNAEWDGAPICNRLRPGYDWSRMLKRTPLFEVHRQLGGKLVEFGGWEMPVQYTSIMDEHKAIRTACGIFDISHMGEVFVSGGDSGSFLNSLLTNDVTRLRPGWGQYSILCNPRGGVVDDLYVYCLEENSFLLIVNASRIEADLQWMRHALEFAPERMSVTIEDRSDSMGAVAVQGPNVAGFIDSVFPAPGVSGGKPSQLKKNQALQIGASGVIVARTGYTGEDGFEIVAPAGEICSIWTRVLEAGAPHGIKPAGLGARDTLRTEVCYPLYGHELDVETSPIEAGLGFFVSFEKGDFIGRAALLEQKTKGVGKKLIAFKGIERAAPPRPGYSLWDSQEGGCEIGRVVSGTVSPTLGLGIGMGHVKPEAAAMGGTLFMEARGRRTPVILCKKPLYRRTQAAAPA